MAQVGVVLLLSLITLKGLKTPENPHVDIVKSERTGGTPNMGTRFERGGHGQRDVPFRNRITCAIRKLWLVKVEIPLKRPENPETPENLENCEAGAPATAGALYVRGKWRLPHGVAYWALARGLLLEPRHEVRQAHPPGRERACLLYTSPSPRD